MLLVPLALSFGCATISQLLPEGPVLTPWERQRAFDGRPSGAAYVDLEQAPHVPFPVLPIVAWGVAYELDLVIVDQDPTWDMHEYAKLKMPDGVHWLAKDARLGTLDQLLTADLPDVETFLPELPVWRRRQAIDVVDLSSDDRIDVALAYTNFDGKRTEAHFTGDPATTPQADRNGSTMGHSRNAVLAVLDLPWQQTGHADVTIDGKKWPLVQIAGLVPFALSLVQTQGGLATSAFTQRASEFGVGVDFALPGGVLAPTEWTVDRTFAASGDIVRLRQSTPFRTLDYAFVESVPATGGGSTLELASVQVRQWGQTAPPCHIEFSPRIPDLRRSFSGTVRSRYVIDIGTGAGHATGWLESSWPDNSPGGGPQVKLLPEAPWWTVDRPMITSVSYPGDGSASVSIVRVPTDARTGLGGKGKSGVQVGSSGER